MPKFLDDEGQSGKITLQDLIHGGLSGEGTSAGEKLIAASLLSLNKTLTRLLDTLEAMGGDELLQARQRQQNARKAARHAREHHFPRDGRECRCSGHSA